MQKTGQRAQKYLKEYGKIGLGTYISIGLLNWAGVYYFMMKGIDFKQLAEKYGYETNSKKWDYIDTVGPVAASYAVYKMMLPLRLPVIIAVTPFVIRVLKRK